MAKSKIILKDNVMNTKQVIPSYLLGHPVSHSKSSFIQNAAFNYYNINSVYLAIDINPLMFDITLAGLKKTELLGLNITLPYKKEIMKFIDELKPEAKLIDAVNTIEIRDKKWIAHNTDWYGVYKTLELHNINKNQDLLIIGAGGATGAVIYGLKEYGINKITITNRTISKAEILKKQFKINLLNFETLNKYVKDYSMIVNCTTLNFNEIINEFNDNIIYFDLKYYSKTDNIKKFIDGSLMLIYQGMKAFKIWTDIDPEIDIMKNALFEKKD